MTARFIPQALFLFSAAMLGVAGAGDVAAVMVSGWSAGALLGARL